jgi:DNA-binding protein HU-beta
MKKSEMVDAVAKQAGLSKAKAQEAVAALFDAKKGAIPKALKAGQQVTITGFGSFVTRARKAREGLNPRTGKKIKIAASNAVGFRPGKALKDAVKNLKK